MDRRAFLTRAALFGGGAVTGAALTGEAAAGPTVPPAFGSRYTDENHLSDLRLVWRVPTARPVVALTFDDGPDPRLTSVVLDRLLAADAVATFYVIGRRAAAYPDLVRRAAAEGHEIGNHTWTHADLGHASEATARDEIARTGDLIDRLIGRRPTSLRPPFGHIAGQGLLAAADLRLAVVMWSVEMHEGRWDAAQNAAHLARAVQPGHIVLAHDGGKSIKRMIGIDAIPDALSGLRARGLTPVTVSDLLEPAEKVVSPKPAPAGPGPVPTTPTART